MEPRAGILQRGNSLCRDKFSLPPFAGLVGPYGDGLSFRKLDAAEGTYYESGNVIRNDAPP